jgi:DNA processing protein
MSEFPLDQPPLARNFPIRNRIIAALSLGTLVVQAAARSGSLITARLALSLGRDVYAVPGRIFDHRAIGPNRLIQDGALLVQHPRDILESLSQGAQKQLLPSPTPKPPQRPVVEGPQGVTFAAIPSGEQVSPEEIAAATNQSVNQVLGHLLELEVAGWISRYPGPRFAQKM